MNIIWGSMIIIGVLVSFLTGNVSELTNAVIASGKDAVNIAFTMCGIVSILSLIHI